MIDKQNDFLTMPTNQPPNPQTAFSSFNQPSLYGNHNSELPLIQSMVEQNQVFKSQQQNLESQLKKLRKISESLLNENISLRSLYKERTHDISKLLNTITINTNQVLIDYQHQDFLIRELNCGILKQIKRFAQEIQDLTQNTASIEQECQQIDNQKLKLQQQTVNKLKIKLKSNLNPRAIDQGQKQQLQQLQKLNNLSAEVIDLVICNKELQTSKAGYRNSKGTYYTLQKQKQQWGNRLKHLNAEIKKYKYEINNDQSNLEKLTEELRYKQEKYKNITKGLNQEVKKYEKYQRNNQEFLAQKETLKQKINQAKRAYNLTQQQLDSIREQKQEILQKIKATKGKLKQFNEFKSSKNESLQNSTEQAIAAMRKTISKHEQDSGEQISKLKKERRAIQQSIEQHEVQVSSLDDKIGTYNKLMKDIENPVHEIERMELMNRLRKVK